MYPSLINLVKGLTGLYLSVHSLNLQTDTFAEIVCREYIQKLLRPYTHIQEAFDCIIKVLVKDSYQEDMRRFLDISTLSERLSDSAYIMCDYDGTHTGWCRGYFVPVSRNEDGTVKEVLFMTQHIEDEQKREERLQQLVAFKLEDIWTTYENLGDIFYAADMDTYELIFMNRMARESCGAASLESIKGKKCYEIIQGRTQPCEFCSNPYLLDATPYEYEFYNPKYKSVYCIRDQKITHYGQNIRIEHAVELSRESSAASQETEQYMLTVINDCIRLALEQQDAEEGICGLMGNLGQLLRMDRMSIFEKAEGYDGWTNTYEWCEDGVLPEKEHLQQVSQEQLSFVIDELKKNNYVAIQDMRVLRDKVPLTYDYLIGRGNRSLIVMPVYINRVLCAFLEMDNLPQEMFAVFRRRIFSVCQVIASMLERRNLRQRLDTLSFYDSMTKLGNRYAVEKFFAHAEPEHALGMVFCDICSLKEVNDTMGHAAGDAFILQVRDVLKTQFREKDIYRWGGDEMLVLIRDIEEAKFKRRCAALVETALQRNAPVATGVLWAKSVPDNWHELIDQADRLMYTHKQQLYEQYDISALLMGNEQLKAAGSEE